MGADGTASDSTKPGKKHWAVVGYRRASLTLNKLPQQFFPQLRDGLYLD